MTDLEVRRLTKIYDHYRHDAAVLTPYTAANLVASVHTARHTPRLLPILPLAFATLHLAYGLGFLAGLWQWRNNWTADQNHSPSQNQTNHSSDK